MEITKHLGVFPKCPDIKTFSEIHFELVCYILQSHLKSLILAEIKWQTLIFDHLFSSTDCQASDSPFFCPSSPASLSSDGLLLRTKNCPSAAGGLGRLEAAIKRLCSSRSYLKIKIYFMNQIQYIEKSWFKVVVINTFILIQKLRMFGNRKQLLNTLSPITSVTSIINKIIYFI